MTGTLVTPFGPVSLRVSGGVIVALDWQAARGPAGPVEAEGLRQLAEYFAGARRSFDLPLDWGSGLHDRVRRAMAAIPFGETRTYGDIARAVGAPAQAVGQACGANPIPILIPCHRFLAQGPWAGFRRREGWKPRWRCCAMKARRGC